MNHARSQRKGNDLFELLRARRGFEATDHRDVIYALLGLVEADQRQLAGAVDYALPVQHVYTLAACNFLRRHSNRGLGPLLSDADAAVSPSGDSQPGGYPSWVPNWALPPACTRAFPEMHTPGSYQGGSPTDEGRYWEIVPDLPILISLGLPLGVIETLGPVFPPPSSVNRLAGRRALSVLERKTPNGKRVTSPESLPAARRYTEAWINLLKDITAKQEPQSAEISKDISLFSEAFMKEIEWSCTGFGTDHIFRLQMDRYILKGISREESHELGISAQRHKGAKPVLEGRRFAVTQRGDLATVPADAQSGDVCVSVFGAKKQFLYRHVPADKSSKTQQERFARKEAAVLEAAQKLWFSEKGHGGLWSKISTPVTVGDYVRLVGQCVVGRDAWYLSYFPMQDLKVYALE